MRALGQGLGGRTALRWRASGLLLGIGLLAMIGAEPARAQARLPGERPQDDRLELPRPADPEPKAPFERILPPYPVPQSSDERGLAGGLRLRLRAVRFEGSTLLDEAALRTLARPYEGRVVELADLLELRDRVTLALIARGFETSGAVLPAQAIEDGVVTLRIVEGRLSAIALTTDGRFAEGYLHRRLGLAAGDIVDVPRLEKRLRRLQLDDRVDRIDARLEPTEVRGRSILAVRIREASPIRARAAFDNYRSPSIGAEGGEAWLEVDNLTGWGDRVMGRVSVSEGLRQFEGRIALPITPWETRLGFRARISDSEIVSDRIAGDLDIESRARSFGLELRQPLVVTPTRLVETWLRGELRRSKSEIDGRGESFVLGPEDGESKVTVLRWGLDWTERNRRSALAARSLFTVGLEALDATSNAGGIADGQFLSWLGQVQLAHRLPPGWLDAELLLRSELQWANSPLLPLEQFSIGGRYSVRGYRENSLVRDGGVSGSIEVAVPLYRRIEPELHWEIVPFFDIGQVWSVDDRAVGDDRLASIGVGTRLRFGDLGRFELFWGHRLEDVTRFDRHDLQDDGIHLRLSVDWP